jgi:hypothetical protein
MVSLCIRTNPFSPIHLSSSHPAEFAYIWLVTWNLSDTDIIATKMTAKPSENIKKIRNDDGTTHLVRMCDASFRDGTTQSLYLPGGWFKGMKMIIQEHCKRPSSS